MNSQTTNSAAIEDEIDLLVDGELSEDRRERLLRRLEEGDDGWKRCAMGFLEAQTWRGAMNEESSAGIGEGRGRRWMTPLATLAAAAMGFLAALGLVGPPDAESAQLEATSAPEPAVRVVPYQVVEHTGFVPASDEGGNLFYRTRGEVPGFFLEALQEAGHDVKFVERLIDLPLEDGEPLHLPITETRVFIKHEL